MTTDLTGNYALDTVLWILLLAAAGLALRHAVTLIWNQIRRDHR